MLVTAEGTVGTVGGGALEMEAILAAREMLAGGAEARGLDVPLGPAIGQCCGGFVQMELRRGTDAVLTDLEAEEAAERAACPHVLVFGAGHTGLELAKALAPLPFRTLVVDTRGDRLAALPESVERRLTPLPEAEIGRAPPGSAYLILTHDHALDFILAAAALSRQDAAYVGMIGSATKRETFRRHLERNGRGEDIRRLVLPIGGALVRDKRPAVIAALTAGELLRHFLGAELQKSCSGFAQNDSECNNEAIVSRSENHAAAS